MAATKPRPNGTKVRQAARRDPRNRSDGRLRVEFWAPVVIASSLGSERFEVFEEVLQLVDMLFASSGVHG